MLIGRAINRSVIAIRSLQYGSGIRDSQLRWPFPRPDAPYRAVVYGLDEAYWRNFDAAFPEYEKAFADESVHASDLRVNLRDGMTALIVFDGVPQRRVQMVTSGLKGPVFHGSFAPIPWLERDGDRAPGFLVDTMGNWRTSRRATEIATYLQYYDLDARPEVAAAGAALLARSALPLAGDDTLVLPDTALEDEAVSNRDEASQFTEHLAGDWFGDQLFERFVERLATVRTVEVRNSPLGLVAALLGREVKVAGIPCWAGYGLTEDMRSLHRKRRLDADAMAGILAFVMSRYASDEDELVDPSDGWAIAGTQSLRLRNTQTLPAA